MNKTTKILYLIGCLLTASLAAESGPTARPEYLGYRVAVPKSLPEKAPVAANLRLQRERIVEVKIRIDNKGRVESVEPTLIPDTLLISHLSEYLSAIPFSPAEFNGKKTEAILPVSIHVEPRRPLPEIEFPIDEQGAVRNRYLYEKALMLAGFEFPEVVMFPTYFCDLEWSDTSSSLRYSLLEVYLDETGEVTAVKPMPSGYQNFTPQLRSAMQYARFEPLKFRGKPLAASVYIRISFFPQLNYPAKPWLKSAFESMSFFERHSIEIIPTDLGLLNYPIPLSAAGESFPVSSAQGRYQDTLSVYLQIDSSGSAIIQRINKTNQTLTRLVRSIFGSLRFYRAARFDGTPQEFSGLLYVCFDGSTNVRFDYLWLHEHKPGSIK